MCFADGMEEFRGAGMERVGCRRREYAVSIPKRQG